MRGEDWALTPQALPPPRPRLLRCACLSTQGRLSTPSPSTPPPPQRWTPPRAGHSRRATFTASQRGWGVWGEVPQAASTSLCMHQHAPEPSFLPLVPLALGAHSSPSTFSTEYVESRTCPFNYAMEGSASVTVFASS